MKPERMLLALGAVAMVATLGVDADARPRRRALAARPSSLFFGASPHVPLAVVAGGRIASAVSPAAEGSCGRRTRWAALVGFQWHALDGWGQIVATETVSAKDAYDGTACAELAFASPLAHDERRVFVSTGSAWKAAPSVRWVPGRTQQTAFDDLLVKMVSDTGVVAANVPPECTAIAERVRFFEQPGEGRFAVGTTNAGYVVAKLGAEGWSVLSVERSKIKTLGAMCYRPIAVFDMNGDGRPEIVMHFSEGAWWGDFVLGLSDDGGWKRIALSPGGTTF